MTITIIGAGNVGFQLLKKSINIGITVQQVYSRTTERIDFVRKNIGKTSINFENDLQKILPISDLYIIAVSDSAIVEVAAQLSQILGRSAFVVHTSGTTPVSVLGNYFEVFGVFYPLQTFSLRREPDWLVIPIFIHVEATVGYNTLPFLYALRQLARHFTPHIYQLNDDQRRTLHIAAVFVNNFTNFLFQMAEKIVEKERLPFDVLRPLINETIEKTLDISPKEAQTGPARRADLETIERHIQILEHHYPPQYAELYTLLSKIIVENYHQKGV
jgi:predicted short-subunit dehydrogenase-like oxidoreductase (DUF2520 family)